MKMKRALMTAAGILGCASMLVACGDGDPGNQKPPVKPPPQVTEFVSLSVDSGNTTLSWDIDGKTYDVYRAETRYGNYSLVESDIIDGEFTDNTRFCYYKVCEKDYSNEIVKEYAVSEEARLFGDNVYVFSADDDADRVAAQIKTVYDAGLSERRSGEFSYDRSAFLLKPGTYNNKIELDVGYYMTYSGLGETPEAVNVNKLYCGNRNDDICDNALCNFWRGAENFTVKSSGTAMWATSQSSSLRAVKVNGNLQLSENSGYTSGGFLSDCYITGSVKAGTQQQWLSRNSRIGKWEGNMWNMCFAGVDGAPSGEYPTNRYTVEDTTTMREKPFLVFDETNGYQIAVPAERENASGYSWSDENLATRIEKYIAQSDIYFARADKDTAKTINDAYKTHSAVVLTPGIYYLDDAIEINANGKVLLGMGLATLMPLSGNSCLVTTGSDISISGILVDAGLEKSSTLVSIGKQGNTGSDVRLYDFYFRVGGFLEMNTAVDCCLKIYSNDTVCDNIWLWRADHGINGNSLQSTSSIGWTKNMCDTGVEIYGDNVTAYALMAEHYQKHNVVWYGDNGKVMFYQCEVAYDVPSQSAWMDGGKNGYSSLHVDSGVNTFTARGLGVYSNFLVNGIKLDSAITVPDKAGITVEHACAIGLNGFGIEAVVNGASGENVSGIGLPNRYLEKYNI